MADDDITRSLLDEYSIADDSSAVAVPSEIERESLRDAFSRYAKVIFHDISDSYPTDADVQCSFSMAADMKYKDGDVVGLFRLGWRSPLDMVISQVVPKPTTENQRDFQVQFRAGELPKDEGEIYQLCYISQGEVWGASVPFEFRRATAEELLVLDSGDIAIVISQSAVAEDLKSQLATIRKDLNSAEAANAEIGKQLAALREENKVLKTRLNDLEKVELVLERLKADNEALSVSRIASQEKLRDADLHIESLNSVVSALQRDAEILQGQINTQAEEIAKQKGLVVEQRGCSQDLIDALREGKELAVREMRAVMADNTKLLAEIDNMTSDKNFGDQIEKLKEDYHNLRVTKEKNESAYKKRIEELLVQLTQLTSDAKKRVSVAEADAEHYKGRVDTLEAGLRNKEHAIQRLCLQLATSCATLPEDSSRNQENMVDQREVLELQNRLKDVRARYEEVCKEVQTLITEMGVLQQTEESLIQSHDRLINRVNALQKFLREAEGCGNTIEASLHQRELAVAKSKLEERDICIESARQRRGELPKQLKELEQERTVLIQQETETIAALATLENTDTQYYRNVPLRTGMHTTETEEGARSYLQYRLDSFGDEITSEVADLHERLRQAAEAYKTLYTEKMHLAQQLAHMQDLERLREMRDEH